MSPLEKETYSIDDILSEVKKRREETEREIKAAGKETDKPQNTEQTQQSEEPQQNEISDHAEKSPTEQQAQAETDFDIKERNRKPGDDEPKANGDLVLDEEPIAEIQNEQAENQESTQAETEPQPEQAENADGEENGEAIAVQPDENGMVDLLSMADNSQALEQTGDKKNKKEKKDKKDKKDKEKFGKTKKGKAIKTLIIILVIAIIAAGVFAFFYINNVLNKVTDDSNGGEDYSMSTYYDGMDFLQEDFPSIEEMSAGEVYSYKEYLKWWYQNGDPVSSTHVLNVLLIGEDTREEKISDTSRADSAIIASINIDTQEVHLTSVLRDLYVYFEVDGVGQYGKINAAASTGGMKCYINTIERYYKIAINNYAVVNFNSFPKIIDALGGVSIKITSAEINEINNHPKTYGNVTIKQTFDGTEGTMKLTGKQALAYCRIRHIDSDGNRANRQKNVLNALFKKMKKSSTLNAVEMVGKLAGYVYTGYSKKELISIGNTAMRDGWLDFEVKSKNVPDPSNSKGGQTFSVAPNNWIWLADIPKDAYETQMEIYGKSNIKLSENRPDYIAMGI